MLPLPGFLDHRRRAARGHRLARAADRPSKVGGSASVRPPHEISIAEGLTEALGEDRVRALDGVAVRSNPPPAAPEIDHRSADRRPGMRITSYDGVGCRARVHRQRGGGVGRSACRADRTRERRRRAVRRAGRASPVRHCSSAYAASASGRLSYGDETAIPLPPACFPATPRRSVSWCRRAGPV